MANDFRKFDDWIGGLVEDNPLASAATVLTSAGLAAMPAVGSTEHMQIVFDPDGLTGAPYAKRVTAHTAAATTATIEATAVIGTARAIDRDTPWVHSLVARDLTGLPRSGTGTPEAVVSAPVGTLYVRTDGGASTTLYIKETGAAGNTGWRAV